MFRDYVKKVVYKNGFIKIIKYRFDISKLENWRLYFLKIKDLKYSFNLFYNIHFSSFDLKKDLGYEVKKGFGYFIFDYILKIDYITKFYNVFIKDYIDDINLLFNDNIITSNLLDSLDLYRDDLYYYDKREFEKKTNKDLIVAQKKSQAKYRQISKLRLRNYILNNTFKYFITLTFNNICQDRENLLMCKKKTTFWLNNIAKKRKTFKYICVPEYHKNKKAFHMHLLVNGFYKKDISLTLKPKQQKIFEKKYSLDLWKFGFSNVKKIKYNDNSISYLKIANYMVKYLSKDKVFKRRFWLSNTLKQYSTKKIIDITNYLIKKNGVFNVKDFYKKGVVVDYFAYYDSYIYNGVCINLVKTIEFFIINKFLDYI